MNQRQQLPLDLPTSDDIRHAQATLKRLAALPKEITNCSSCKKLRKEAETTEKAHQTELRGLDAQHLEALQEVVLLKAALEQQSALEQQLEVAQREVARLRQVNATLQNGLDAANREIAVGQKRTRDAISLMTHGTVSPSTERLALW